jgi:hypothetical protein
MRLRMRLLLGVELDFLKFRVLKLFQTDLEANSASSR